MGALLPTMYLSNQLLPSFSPASPLSPEAQCLMTSFSPTGWPLSMMEKLGISDLAGKLPRELLPLGAPVGGLTAEAAAHLGLPPGTLVAQVKGCFV